MDTPPVDVVDRVSKVVEVQGDTCDACGKKAWVYAALPVSVKLPNGGSLSYCGHHGTEYIPGLRTAGATIVDLRHLILE